MQNPDILIDLLRKIERKKTTEIFGRLRRPDGSETRGGGLLEIPVIRYTLRLPLLCASEEDLQDGWGIQTASGISATRWYPPSALLVISLPPRSTISNGPQSPLPRDATVDVVGVQAGNNGRRKFESTICGDGWSGEDRGLGEGWGMRCWGRIAGSAPSRCIWDSLPSADCRNLYPEQLERCRVDPPLVLSGPPLLWGGFKHESH